MNIISGIALFFMIWWLVIFAVLPFWVKRDTAVEDGNAAGAPQSHNMMKKVIATTIITFVIWIGVYYLVHSDLISFREMASEMEMK